VVLFGIGDSLSVMSKKVELVEYLNSNFKQRKFETGNVSFTRPPVLFWKTIENLFFHRNVKKDVFRIFLPFQGLPVMQKTLSIFERLPWKPAPNEDVTVTRTQGTKIRSKYLPN
jgi:hypothetical protein